MSTITLILAAAFELWWVDPYGDKPYLPDAEPYGGVITNALELSAAKGEIEVVSFSVRPDRDMKKVDFIPGDMIGPGGAKIPASAADFMLVKCWYRAGGRWDTSWCGHLSKPELINDLVLHDNDLIRVVEDEDYAKRTDLIRFSYPDGDVWVDMRKHGGKNDRFLHEVYPVKDAPKFVPFDLAKGRFQQYWFLWKIPRDAKPGHYKGQLAVKENGQSIDSIPVEIEVYPFSLPDARTHYDTTRPFINSWMGTPILSTVLPKAKDLKVAETKCYNVYRSLAEHNAHEANGPGAFAANSTEDLAVRSLILMRQAGMRCNLLINDMSCDRWACPVETPFIPPEKDPQLYAQVMKRYCAKLDVATSVLDQYLGHRNTYFCGPDECGSYQHRRDYGFFAEIEKRGMHTWSDSGVAADTSWSNDMDDTPAAARHTRAWERHAAGQLCVTYAGTFSGPSCPDIWRRKGVRYYFADFDGFHEYCFNYNRWNHWNDFKYRGNYTQMQIIYYTYDGLLSTLAWEGVRESMDDVRYMTLLRISSEKAMKSSDAKTCELGRKYYHWLDCRDPERIVDLHKFRREVARRAAELVALVGEEPERQALKPVPELPPSVFEKTIAEKDPVKFAQALSKADRYDLSIPAWRSVLENTALSVEVRADAAMSLADELCYLTKREEAILALDEAGKLPQLPARLRGRLALKRVDVLLSNRVYEEEFSREQLNAASKFLKSGLGASGASNKERFEAVMRMAGSYRAGGFPQDAYDFIEGALGEVKFDNQQRVEIFLFEAKLRADLQDWDGAAKFYRIARQTDTSGRLVNQRGELLAEASVAEKREDWITAQRCYGDAVKTYNEEEEDLKAGCIKNLARVTEKVRKTTKSAADENSMEDSGTTIDLDE